jgi:hypothetical protein
MTKTHAAGMALALGLLTLSGSSFDAVAKSNGVATRPAQPSSTPASRPVMSWHRGAFRRFSAFGVPWPPYGPLYYVASGELNGDLVEATAAAEPPVALTCKRSQQIVSVPSWDGGMKEVRITRC